jgi:hypothetical protein
MRARREATDENGASAKIVSGNGLPHRMSVPVACLRIDFLGTLHLGLSRLPFR